MEILRRVGPCGNTSLAVRIIRIRVYRIVPRDESEITQGPDAEPVGNPGKVIVTDTGLFVFESSRTTAAEFCPVPNSYSSGDSLAASRTSAREHKLCAYQLPFDDSSAL